MFNPTNTDKVSVQATHLEASKGKHVFEDMSKKSYKFKKQLNGKGKSKKISTLKKDEEKHTCSN
jgi:hypothetical protein